MQPLLHPPGGPVQRFATRLVVALMAPITLGVLGGCGGDSDRDNVGRGVLVIAIDGLRADHLSGYGYDRPTTPHLDALAAEGVRFDQAFSTSPLRLPAHVPLFTGCDPNVARRRYLVDEFTAGPEERWAVPDKVPHLAVELLMEGFATAAFVDHPDLGPDYGFGRGFQRYLVTEHEIYGEPEERGIQAVRDRFLQWVRGLERSKPWFAYLHLHDLERVWQEPDPLWEAHFSPRPELDRVPPVASTDEVFFALPRSRWRGGGRTLGYYEALYDGHLRKLDAELDDLLRALELQGRYENTTVVVVGTHGVQFGEAGLLLRSGLFSTADVRVPWILRSPRIPPERRGTVLEGVASLLDVAPTLLDFLRLPAPGGMHGTTQLPYILDAGAEAPRSVAFATCGLRAGGAAFGPRWTYEATIPGRVLGDAHQRRTWFGDDREHEGSHEVYYDRTLQAYPPLFGQGMAPPHEVRALQAAAVAWEHNLGRARKALQGGTILFDPVEPEEIAELQALGFLGDGF